MSDINPGSNSSSPQYLTVYNGNLFFSADNGTVGNELFKYNGASVSLLTDVIPGSASGNPINLILSGGFYISVRMMGLMVRKSGRATVTFPVCCRM